MISNFAFYYAPLQQSKKFNNIQTYLFIKASRPCRLSSMKSSSNMPEIKTNISSGIMKKYQIYLLSMGC